MILNLIIPVNISFITNSITILLLIICYYFLGKKFLMNSLLSSICYMLFFSIFSTLPITFEMYAFVGVIIASIMVGFGYYLCLSANSSAVGFDVLALVIKKNHPATNVALTMRYINLIVIFLGIFSYGTLAVIYGIVFTFLQTQVIKVLLPDNYFQRSTNG